MSSGKSLSTGMTTMHIISVDQDDLIQACYPVLVQLRTNLVEAEFLAAIRSQMASGYRLLAAQLQSRIMAVAGYRIAENLAWGRYLYVDDLVSDRNYRSQGAGHLLMQHMIGIAKQQQCQQLHLDSGVQRFEAHRFYLREKMVIASHHFMINL